MTGIATLAQALAQIERIKDQQSLMSMYSTQLSTGKKTQQFSGLTSDVLTSQRARTDIQALKTYQNNVTHASRRIDLMVTSLQEFKEQATNLLGFIQTLSKNGVHQEGQIAYYDDPTTTTVEETAVGVTSAEPEVDMQNLLSFAKNVFSTFESLLNAKDGDRYLFGGAETQQKPFTNSGTMDAAVSSLISDWKNGNISSTGLISDLNDRSASSNPNALTDSIIGYSDALSTGNVGKVYVRAGESFEINYTALANENPLRDIMVAISYFKNEDLMPIADVYIPPNVPSAISTPDVQGAPGATLKEQTDNFFQVMDAIAGSVSNALDGIDAMIGRLSQAQARVQEIEESQNHQINLLNNIVGDVEDVDRNEVALKVSTLATQIEISYSVTARVSQLTLINYLPI